MSKEQLWEQKLRLALAGARELLAATPAIKAIGLTGSVAWGDVVEDDDLDYLIITQENRVYTARWQCYRLASRRGRKYRRERVRDAWCLNIFLDEKALVIPEAKRSEFAVRQLGRLLPLYDPHDLFSALVQKNYFWTNEHPEFERAANIPASFAPLSVTDGEQRPSLTRGSWWGDRLEAVLYYLQWGYQRRRQTVEIVSRKQIFFHPLVRE